MTKWETQFNPPPPFPLSLHLIDLFFVFLGLQTHRSPTLRSLFHSLHHGVACTVKGKIPSPGFLFVFTTCIARLTSFGARVCNMTASVDLWGRKGAAKWRGVFMLKKRWAWLRDVCRGVFFCLVPPLNCQEQLSFFHEWNVCLWFVVSTVLVENATCQYWLVIVCAVIFRVLLQGGVKQIKRLLRHRVWFVDLSSWMLAGETFACLLSVGHATSFPPIAASHHRSHFSHVFVAIFSSSFLQFYLKVIFLWFIRSCNIQHAWFYSRRSSWYDDNKNSAV